MSAGGLGPSGALRNGQIGQDFTESVFLPRAPRFPESSMPAVRTAMRSTQYAIRNTQAVSLIVELD